MSSILKVGIIGLGYVGLTLGVALARRGVKIYGIEKRSHVVDLTNNGVPHFSETGLEVALEEVVREGMMVAAETLNGVEPLDVYVITVGTPLKAGTYQPRLDMIEQATRQVAEHMPDGATVILRSTVKVGTTNDIVRPILEASGKTSHLCMCPERTLEGDALRELLSLPQIIGGVDDAAADRAASLFSRLTHTVVRVASAETAEMIKLVDNTSRDVRFAFANEVARACDALGINGLDVIRFGKLGYPRTNVALPGLVGGPCLEKDPHILQSSVAHTGLDLEITRASRLVNERQPFETINDALAILMQRGIKPPYRVAVAGLAFKGVPETDDLRGSMALRVIEALKNTGQTESITVFDRVVKKHEIEELPFNLVPFDTLTEAAAGVHMLIIANNHPYFTTINIDEISSHMADDGIVFDYWASITSEAPSKLKGRYYTVGNQAGRF